jgi:UDP-GlcNAc:undecaprenyl-phosphate GlcNAc-1-phosphate transferase
MAGGLSWLLMLPASKLGLKLGLADLPSSRRVRARPVPTTGGIVIFVAFAAAMVASGYLLSGASPELVQKVRILLLGGSAIVILGMIDDRVNLRPQTKLIAQTIIAAAVVAGGVGMTHIRFVVGPTHDLGWIGFPLTVFWFVAFINALNLIDGLDGLAGGIAGIAALGLFAVGAVNGNAPLFFMAAGLLGATGGFLIHNFGSGNVYLGDAGSMTLGFLLAGGAVVGARSDAASTALLVAAACMGVPIFDVVTSILRRWRSGRGIMTPDRSHVHHRLIRFGLSPRRAVIVLWGVTIFFGGQMLGLSAVHGVVYVLLSYVAAMVVGNVLLTQRRKNMRTTERDIREEMLYLMGARDRVGDEEPNEEPGLRAMIVEQIRREARYRRMVQAESGVPLRGTGAARREALVVRATRESVRSAEASDSTREFALDAEASDSTREFALDAEAESTRRN